MATRDEARTVRAHPVRQERRMTVPNPMLPRLDLVRVEDVMEGILVGCDASAPLSLVGRILAEERIHCLVVGGLERTLAGRRVNWGIVSDRDLLRALAASDPSVTAGAIATTEPVTVERHEPLERAVQLMDIRGVNHVIVVDDGRPVGIVSTLDVARAAAA
jgi:CBS domain-containing protein